MSQLAATLIGGAFAVAVWGMFLASAIWLVRIVDSGRPKRNG